VSPDQPAAGRIVGPPGDTWRLRRPGDWLRQAELDLAAAGDIEKAQHFEWACFLAQQAAEKAAKAAHESVGTEAWGHSVAGLLAGLEDVPDAVMDAARSLDKHYIPARDPNSHPEGAPGDLYTAREAEQALRDAATVIEHVKGRLPPA
jgi:HEPN domain-containing protein